MEKKLNTTYTFEFADGTTTELNLSFIALYKLRAKNKALYERYNKIMAKKNLEELEMVATIYVAYLCAHFDEEVMSEEEFIIRCGSDRNALFTAYKELTQPKKPTSSEKHSGVKP